MLRSVVGSAQCEATLCRSHLKAAGAVGDGALLRRPPKLPLLRVFNSFGRGQMSTSSLVANPAAAQVATRVRWKISLLMLMLFSINYIDRTSLSVAMPLIGKEFDLDPAMQGPILSSFFWTYAF